MSFCRLVLRIYAVRERRFKPGANGCNIVGQHFIGCYMLRPSAKSSETDQTFSYVQTEATTPNNVRSCWPTMVRPFAPGFTDCSICFSHF